MKTIIALVAIAMTSSTFAADSSWLLCKGKAVLFESRVNLVVNSHEHRTAEGRENSLTLIYGAHLLNGNLDTTENDSGSIVLKNDQSNFTGTVSVDYNKGIMTLNGTLNLQGEESVLKTRLVCEALN